MREGTHEGASDACMRSMLRTRCDAPTNWTMHASKAPHAAAHADTAALGDDGSASDPKQSPLSPSMRNSFGDKMSRLLRHRRPCRGTAGVKGAVWAWRVLK